MRSLLTALVLLVQLSGCAQLDTVRLGQDRPEDLQLLMDRHEYARAGQLLDKYPHLDTAERRQLLHDGISRYQDSILDSAQEKAGNDNLVGAIMVLDEALLKVPGIGERRAAAIRASLAATLGRGQARRRRHGPEPSV